MRSKTAIAVAVLLLTIAATLLLVLDIGEWPRSQIKQNQEQYSKPAFDSWLQEHPDRVETFRDFQAFLRENEVAEIVPAWQLTRTDNDRSKGCDRPEFLIPPRTEWPNIVPVIRLVGVDIIPAIGPLEVVSSYRTTSFNDCVGGAQQSRHLSFSALDLKPVNEIENAELFRKLCNIHELIGRENRMGLGAYFDPANPVKASGRFHIDVSGFRSWGRTRTSDSSGCLGFD